MHWLMKTTNADVVMRRISHEFEEDCGGYDRRARTTEDKTSRIIFQ